MDLRYGLNPERQARATLDAPGSPIRALVGHPSYVNVLDGIGAWCLVREASSALASPAAASFKHVSPAGAAMAGHLDEVMVERWVPAGVEPSAMATAYVRARDCDPRSSFGDFVAVSEPVDYSFAQILRGVVSDGIIAPGYEPGTVELLAAKKGGRYVVLEANPSFTPPAWETRDLFGVRLEQQTTPTDITPALIQARTGRTLPEPALRDLLWG